MNITLVSPNLAENCLGRTLILAELLEHEHSIRIVGPMFGRAIWAPARNTRFEIVGVEGRRWPMYLASRRRLLDLIDGDVIIACKPLPTSFGAALAAQKARPRPLILDIDDDEAALVPVPPFWQVRSVLAHAVVPNGGWAIRHTLAQRSLAHAITVASRGLQVEYGGTLLPHSKDTDCLTPRPGLRAAAKEALGVAGRRVVMFLGSPRPWKGLEVAAAAIEMLTTDATLVVLGASPADARAAGIADRRCVHVLGARPLEELPFLLQAADVIVVPQREDLRAARQLPSKLLDAMAAGLPIVATAVGDIPMLLGEGRGLIVAPDNAAALAAALDQMLMAPEDARAMGARARRWCEEHASHRVLRDRLGHVLQQAIRVAHAN